MRQKTTSINHQLFPPSQQYWIVTNQTIIVPLMKTKMFQIKSYLLLVVVYRYLFFISIYSRIFNMTQCTLLYASFKIEFFCHHWVCIFQLRFLVHQIYTLKKNQRFLIVLSSTSSFISHIPIY